MLNKPIDPRSIAFLDETGLRVRCGACRNVLAYVVEWDIPGGGANRGVILEMPWMMPPPDPRLSFPELDDPNGIWVLNNYGKGEFRRRSQGQPIAGRGESELLSLSLKASRSEEQKAKGIIKASLALGTWRLFHPILRMRVRMQCYGGGNKDCGSVQTLDMLKLGVGIAFPTKVPKRYPFSPPEPRACFQITTREE